MTFLGLADAQAQTARMVRRAQKGFEAVKLGLGGIVALYFRASTPYKNREHIRCLYF
jgi:hypothetical protein